MKSLYENSPHVTDAWHWHTFAKQTPRDISIWESFKQIHHCIKVLYGLYFGEQKGSIITFSRPVAVIVIITDSSNNVTVILYCSSV